LKKKKKKKLYPSGSIHFLLLLSNIQKVTTNPLRISNCPKKDLASIFPISLNRKSVTCGTRDFFRPEFLKMLLGGFSHPISHGVVQPPQSDHRGSPTLGQKGWPDHSTFSFFFAFVFCFLFFCI
jgi:hypothetical protein